MPTQAEKEDERSGLRLFGYLSGAIGIACGAWGVIDAADSISKDEYNVSAQDKANHSLDELRSMYVWTLILLVIPFLLSSVLVIYGTHTSSPNYLCPFIVLMFVQSVLAFMGIIDDNGVCPVLLSLLRGGICLVTSFFIYRLRVNMYEYM